MRILIRTLMAASLIMADAAQAASLAMPQGGREAVKEQVTSYDARLKNILDRDEKSWKRVSASICAGCGSPPPPLEIARATPLYVRTQREAAVATPGPSTTTAPTAPATRPASVQSAALREYEGERTRVVRSKPNHVRLTARARRYARYAHLRMLRHQRRLALLQAQKRHALLASQARHHAHRVRLATMEFGTSEQGEGRSGDERPPVPLPPPRPDTLCADNRGLVTSAARYACVSAQ